LAVVKPLDLKLMTAVVDVDYFMLVVGGDDNPCPNPLPPIPVPEPNTLFLAGIFLAEYCDTPVTPVVLPEILGRFLVLAARLHIASVSIQL